MNKKSTYLSLALGISLLSVGSARGEGLVDIQWVKENQKKLNLVFLEVSNQEYTGPHIENALHTVLSKDGWVSQYENLLNMLPPKQIFSKTVSKYGLSKDKDIVLVSTSTSEEDLAATTRIFWSLSSYGYSRIHLLNGGVPEFFKHTLHKSKTAKQPNASDVTLSKPNNKISASYNQVYAGSDYGTPVIDARDYARAGGDAKRHPLALRQGKIFDAEIIPATTQFNTQTGKFKSKEQLKALYSDVFGTPTGPVVVYSDTGIRAAISWFAIRYVMGEKDVRLYDGSYLEWDHLGHEVYDETDDMGGPIGG